MSADAGLGPLVALAHCLARPVRRGWLTIETADACLVVALCRMEAPGLDVLAVWRGLQGDLRRAVRS
jgi:hypothetical protein